MADRVLVEELMFTIDGKRRVKGMFAVLRDMAEMDPVPVEELRHAIRKYSNDVDRFVAVSIGGKKTDDNIMVPYQTNKQQ